MIFNCLQNGCKFDVSEKERREEAKKQNKIKQKTQFCFFFPRQQDVRDHVSLLLFSFLGSETCKLISIRHFNWLISVTKQDSQKRSKKEKRQRIRKIIKIRKIKTKKKKNVGFAKCVSKYQQKVDDTLSQSKLLGGRLKAFFLFFK